MCFPVCGQLQDKDTDYDEMEQWLATHDPNAAVSGSLCPVFHVFLLINMWYSVYSVSCISLDQYVVFCVQSFMYFS